LDGEAIPGLDRFSDPVSLAIPAPQPHRRRLNHMLPRACFGNVYLQDIPTLAGEDAGRHPVPAGYGNTAAACS
jgi:hypothetical protein